MVQGDNLFKLGDDFWRNRRGFDPGGVGRIAGRPNARFETLDGERAAAREPVLDVEAGAAEFLDGGFDHDVVAEFRRHNEARARIHHSMRTVRLFISITNCFAYL